MKRTDRQNISDEVRLEFPETVLSDLRSFERSLAISAASPIMEPVPAEMLSLFNDAQWPELIFETQPSLHIVITRYDVLKLRELSEQDTPQLGNHIPRDEGTYRWLIFRSVDEQLVRQANSAEIHGLQLMEEGCDFDKISTALWPERPKELRHERLTNLILRFVEEGLIIDVGVPIPDGAEFETGTTQSAASSPEPETGTR